MVESVSRIRQLLLVKKVSLFDRFPRIQKITPVYAVGVTLLYSWTIFNAMQAFSSNWRLFLGMGDILSLFAYMLAGDFLESLLLISILLVLSFLLPGNILKDKFILRGSILVITFLGSIMVFYLQLSKNLIVTAVLDNISTWVMIFTVSTLVLLTLGEWSKTFGKFVESIADRCVVFLYLYLPVTFLSLVTIILRNLG